MKHFFTAFLIMLALMSEAVRADGTVIDKIYHPYVQPLEQELGARMIDERSGSENRQLYKLGYGRSITDRLFAEVYLVGENPGNSSFDITSYEIETKWQLTEQGEYWADWGLLTELEKYTGDDIWEMASALLVEKEWGRWSGTANFAVHFEWGDDIDDELDTVLALQTRYRLSRVFEPGLELYSGENTKGIGPVFMGQIKLGIKKMINWEAGVIFALDHESADQTVRFSMEFEF